MGRIGKTIRWIFVCLGAVVLGFSLVSCENDLMSYLFNSLFYEGWKVKAWSTPAPVVDGETHLQGTAYRNGFPMNMAMGSNGKLHLIVFKVSARDWVYTTLEPGSERFVQSFTMVNDMADNPGSIALMPGIDLISDDVPYIVYSHGSGYRTLSFQDYNNMTGWGSEEVLYTEPSNKIKQTFLFFLVSDFKSHIFYVTEETPNKMYHTRKLSSGIDPDPPELFIGDVGHVGALRRGNSEVIFIYTDSSGQNLYYRTYSDPTVSTIWSVTDTSLSIGEIAVALDSEEKIHVCFGTYKTAEPLNTAYGAIHYINNSSGSWEEEESISGTSTSGPLAVFFPPSIDISQDKHGNDHLHIAYTVYNPPANFFIWYAYYDEAGWQISEQSLDTINTNSFWTFPLLAVDPGGTVYIVYSWTETELDRTSMYIRGTPEESQQ